MSSHISHTFSYWVRILILLAIVVFGATLFSTIYASDTGVVSGRVWMDDDTNQVYDVSTDSNGVQDSVEWISGPVKVFIVDANGLQIAFSHPVTGDFSKTVSTLTPVTVTVDIASLNIPSNFDPTTEITHTVNVSTGATTTVPSFGFGPPIE